ncbi:hypothetical protein M2401_000812 [Pseudomonas sp. JUb42]|uniref:hypothetical protein n=1 Tax=Pseudomonas sp. JUb42 TaxID=2940611 RepID=UPI0021696F36|nr:hypothetical protein [Pseudomonas sp. JUb42]MCS3467091.1 hypothetical protein [Pseudomonas sp. JUb42]
MAKVTNTSKNPVVLSDGTFLPVGEEVDVKDWAKLKDHHVTAAMVESGELQAGAAKTEDKK